MKARMTSRCKSSRQKLRHRGQFPVVLVGNSSYVPGDLRPTVDRAIEKLQDPQEAVNALDEVLGIDDVRRATGEALDDPGAI